MHSTSKSQGKCHACTFIPLPLSLLCVTALLSPPLLWFWLFGSNLAKNPKDQTYFTKICRRWLLRQVALLAG